MSNCLSILALNRSCTTLIGGVEKLFLIPFDDLEQYPGAFDVYKIANGIITNLNVKENKSFVEVGALKNTIDINESLQTDKGNGVKYFQKNLSFDIADINPSTINFVKRLVFRRVFVVVLSRTGKYYATGIDNGLSLTSLNGTTGFNYEDKIGYSLSFTGFDKQRIIEIDKSLVKSYSSEELHHIFDIEFVENYYFENIVHFN